MKRNLFVCFITFCSLVACKTEKIKLQSVNNQNIKLNNTFASDTEIEAFVLPYRQHIEKQLESVLAYNPTDLVKETHALSVPISNFMADAMYRQANLVFSKRMGKNLDFVVLNWGGIRSGLPKGNITTRSAFNLMPFENRLVAVQITGKKVLEMGQYLASEQIPNPVSKQVFLRVDAQNQVVDFKIHSKPINPDALYWVGTTDYLLRGGDRMYFFKDAPQVIDLEYQARKALIDYFTEIDTLKTQSDDRFKKM